MKIKLMLVAAICSLFASFTVFAAMTPEEKNTAAEEAYQKNQGEKAEQAKNTYQNMSPGQQEQVKQKELKHRENIHEQHKTTVQSYKNSGN